MTFQALLLAPPLDGEFAALPALWRRSMLLVEAERPAGFDCGPSLPARLRGALGHALIAAGEAGEAESEVARALLFGASPVWRARAEVPKPFVIAAQECGATIDISLTLFGFADRWREPVFDHFLTALARGVACDEKPGSLRVPLSVRDVRWTRLEETVVPAPQASARLLFRTPLRLGPRHVFGMRWSDLVVSLAERAAGLARWQGVRVEPRLSFWRDLGNRLDIRGDDMQPVYWERRSGAQDGRVIPMLGLTGALDILKPPEVLMPLLALGETMHVGAAAALGLGRYDLL